MDDVVWHKIGKICEIQKSILKKLIIKIEPKMSIDNTYQLLIQSYFIRFALVQFEEDFGIFL